MEAFFADWAAVFSGGFTMVGNYQERLLEGAKLTLLLALSSLGVSLLAGMVACAAKMSRHRLLRGAATAYTTVVRGVPDLIQLFLLYYGGEYLLQKLGVKATMSPFATGVLAIGFIFGAYMAESFRGGFLAIPKGQIEAARAYGMAPFTVFWRISRPQMLRYALPSIGNNWLVLMKSTALVSIIQLQDIVFVAKGAATTAQKKDIYAGFWFYGAVSLFFLLLTTVSILVLWWLKRRYSAGFVMRDA
ncbi:MAG: ABC transporter permease subunit [Cardiobacteriaceae bacterium]|nr:ABC transporter permease subunit [Cardiobacteriaceae bacterium]